MGWGFPDSLNILLFSGSAFATQKGVFRAIFYLHRGRMIWGNRCTFLDWDGKASPQVQQQSNVPTKSKCGEPNKIQKLWEINVYVGSQVLNSCSCCSSPSKRKRKNKKAMGCVGNLLHKDFNKYISNVTWYSASSKTDFDKWWQLLVKSFALLVFCFQVLPLVFQTVIIV